MGLRTTLSEQVGTLERPRLKLPASPNPILPPDMKNRLIEIDPDAGKNQKQRGKREAEDVMLREHH